MMIYLLDILSMYSKVDGFDDKILVRVQRELN
jgi:hypothetical protein